MAIEEIPAWIRVNRPALPLIDEALAAYREGRPSTAPCPICNGQLNVIDVEGTSSFVVECRNGHILLQADGKSRMTRPDSSCQGQSINAAAENSDAAGS